MRVDNELIFTTSSGQPVTAAAASTDYINVSEARDIGTGQALYVVGIVTVAMTDAGSDSTLNVKLQTDDNTGFSSATDGQDLFTFPATSAIGTVKIARIQPDALDEQYCRTYFTPANGDLTTGTFKVFITDTIQKWKAYPDNVTIS